MASQPLPYRTSLKLDVFGRESQCKFGELHGTQSPTKVILLVGNLVRVAAVSILWARCGLSLCWLVLGCCRRARPRQSREGEGDEAAHRLPLFGHLGRAEQAVRAVVVVRPHHQSAADRRLQLPGQQQRLHESVATLRVRLRRVQGLEVALPQACRDRGNRVPVMQRSGRVRAAPSPRFRTLRASVGQSSLRTGRTTSTRMSHGDSRSGGRAVASYSRRAGCRCPCWCAVACNTFGCCTPSSFCSHRRMKAHSRSGGFLETLTGSDRSGATRSSLVRLFTTSVV